MLKFQAVAEKTAKNFRGLFFAAPCRPISVFLDLFFFCLLKTGTFMQVLRLIMHKRQNVVIELGEARRRWGEGY